LEELQLAAKLWPWNRAIRTKPGYAMLETEPSAQTISVLQATIANDRHSIDLIEALLRHQAAVKGK